MDGPECHEECVEVQALATHQSKLLRGTSWVWTPIWLWIMDPEGNPEEVSERMLHSNATCCAECQLERARNQQGTVCWAATNEWQDCIQEDAICRLLWPTPASSSWQTCAMGAITCTLAPIEAHLTTTFVELLAQDAGGGELGGAGLMYGWKRWLENKLANSSEDELKI